MCGICGVYAYASESGADEAVLVSMRDQMTHRGPDDAGLYLSHDRRVGLGFRRLAIVDLTPTGHQPMSNEDGSVWVVFNGEIYNHADHRTLLEQKGHVYRGRSDTETLVHLYEEYGKDCVHRLRGMFAFAVWDEKREELFLARDRVGIKPLYFTTGNGFFLFGSEIKALMAHSAVSREVDDEALFHYLTFMVSPAPLTLFRGIYKLPPGHCVSVDRTGQVRIEQYWDAQSRSPISSASEAEAIERVRQLVDDAVRLRMMSDVPIGAFLSGGIDSSTVVALMARYSSRPVNTYTVGYTDSPASNELVYARQVAREFGTHHQEVMVGGQDMLDYMAQLVHTQDEPIADPVCVPLYYLSKLAHESSVKVILVGEGSDELFCGYPWYLPYIREDQQWSRWMRFLPEAIVKAGYGTAAWALRAVGRGHSLAEMMERRRRGEPTFWGGAIVYSGRLKQALLNESYWNGRHLDSADIVRNHYHRANELRPDLDILGRMTYLELKHRLPELLLMRLDKVGMSVSLEARVPFLDHHLVEFVSSLPLSIKIKKEPKYLLKKVVEGLLPQNIIHRPKQGFPAPVNEWFRTIPAGAIENAILGGPLIRRDYFNQEFVRQMLADHFSGRRDSSVRLWVLYNLSLWYDHWIDQTVPR